MNEQAYVAKRYTNKKKIITNIIEQKDLPDENEMKTNYFKNKYYNLILIFNTYIYYKYFV